MALLAAVTLDGVPENIALGVSLGEGTGGLALLAAIFVSNLPEALVGASSMRSQGRSAGGIMVLWTVCAVLLVVAVVIGAGPLSSSDPRTISLPLAFAAGAVIASLADTLMPEAFDTGVRRWPSVRQLVLSCRSSSRSPEAEAARLKQKRKPGLPPAVVP